MVERHLRERTTTDTGMIATAGDRAQGAAADTATMAGRR